MPKTSDELIIALLGAYHACGDCLRDQRNGPDHADWCAHSRLRQMLAEEPAPPEVVWEPKVEGYPVTQHFADTADCPLLYWPTWTTAEDHGSLLLPLALVTELEQEESPWRNCVFVSWVQPL